jgi:VWFA-related protein
MRWRTAFLTATVAVVSVAPAPGTSDPPHSRPLSIAVVVPRDKDLEEARRGGIQLRLDGRDIGSTVAIDGRSAPSASASSFFEMASRQTPGYTNASAWQQQPGASRTAILVDLLNSSGEQRAQLRKAVLKFLQSGSASAHVPIYALTSRLQLLQDSSGDGANLIAAIRKLEDPANDDPLTLTAERGALIPAPSSTNASPLEFLQSVNDYLKFDRDAAAEDRAAITFSALNSMARHLAVAPGRKQLIWFSGAFGCGFAAVDSLVVAECSRFRTRARASMQHLQQGLVSVYPLTLAATEDKNTQESPRGFERPIRQHFVPQPASSVTAEFGRSMYVRDVSMQLLAAVSGGRLLGRKSLADAVRAASADGDHSLQLIFPETPRAGAQPSSLQVSLRGKSDRLLYPKFLYRGAPEETSEDDITAELQDELGGTRELIAEIPLAIRSIQEKPTADLIVDAAALTVTIAPDGSAGIDLDLGSATLSGAFRPLATSTFRVRRSLPAADAASLRRDGLLLHVNYTPHRRGERVRFAVRDRATGRIGTVDLPLDCRCPTLLDH